MPAESAIIQINGEPSFFTLLRLAEEFGVGIALLDKGLIIRYASPNCGVLFSTNVEKVLGTHLEETPCAKMAPKILAPNPSGDPIRIGVAVGEESPVELDSLWAKVEEGWLGWIWNPEQISWKAIKELNEQRQYTESIFTALPDLLFVLDKDGKFLESKAANEESLALPLEQFQNKYLKDVFPASLASSFNACITECLTKQAPTSIQYQLMIKDELRDYEARFSPFGTDKVVALARDITSIKDTERNLLETKRFFEQAGRMASVGAFEYFPHSQKLTWSTVTRDIHDVPQDYTLTLDKALSFYAGADAQERVREAVNLAIKHDKSSDLECGLLTYSGELKWVRVIIDAETDAKNNKRVFGTIQDITERKRILENKQQFINEAPSAIAMLDTRMRYLAYSKKWLEDYGLPPEEDLLGRSHYDVFPEIGEEWKAIHQACLKGETHHSTLDRFERTDGSVNYMKWTVKPWRDGSIIGGIIMLTEDITAEKIALSNQKKLSKIVEESLNEIYTFGRNLIIQQANKAAERNLQYGTEELRTMKITDLLPEFPEEVFVKTHLSKLAAPEDKALLESVHQRKDNSRYPVKIHIKRLVVDEEEYYVAIVLDITERIRHVNAIREQNRILKEIAWNQSHVLRAPLSRMMMLLSLLENQDIEFNEHDLLKSREEVIHAIQETATEIDSVVSEISKKIKTLDPSVEPESPPVPISAEPGSSPEFWIIDQDELSQLVTRYAVIQHRLAENPKQFQDPQDALTSLSNLTNRAAVYWLLDIQTAAVSGIDWPNKLKQLSGHNKIQVITLSEEHEKIPKYWSSMPCVAGNLTKPLKKAQINWLKNLVTL